MKEKRGLLNSCNNCGNCNQCCDPCDPCKQSCTARYDCQFNIEVSPYDPTTWVVTIGGMTYKVKVPECNETDTTLATASFKPIAAGTLCVRITVKDSTGNSAVKEFTVNVSE